MVRASTHNRVCTIEEFVQGDVMRLWIPGRNMIVLNSDKTSKDLLQSRGSKYSSRLQSVVFTMYGLSN
jgi:hypothetical protein